MLAERLPTLLPNLPLAQALETTAVLSIADHRRSAVVALNGLVERPPFEAPHHSASVSSLVGGGVGLPRPGLISTANNGVLFLDEAPEFQLPVLEALRQPLESGEVLINRSAGTARFPAKFQLVLAANPCPCGRSFGQARGCTCSEVAKRKYANKLSGPLLDRIDIRLAISAANAGQMALDLEAAQENQMTSKQLRQQVQCARELAADRLSATPWSLNVQVPGSYLRKQLRLATEVTQPIDRALAKGKISMRGYDRCLRLAWSIADLAGCDQPRREHIVEAAYLRGSDSPMVGV
jgi:magnesium chelatase family protein